MEFATQFFEGLDGPASLTFLGIVTAAFLLGLLPAGLNYAVRVRTMRRQLTRHREALAKSTEERQKLADALTREGERSSKLTDRLRLSVNTRAGLDLELQRLQADANSAAQNAMAAEVSAYDQANLLEGLRTKVSTLTAQVQSLKATQQRRSNAVAPSTFDLDVMASLNTVRARAEGLEKRVAQLTADNEHMRHQLSGGGPRQAPGSVDPSAQAASAAYRAASQKGSVSAS